MMRPTPIQLATACTWTGRYDQCEPICGVDVVLTKFVLPRHHKSGCGRFMSPVTADTGWHSPRRASSTSARSKMRSRRIVRYSMAEWMTPTSRSTPSSSGVAARIACVTDVLRVFTNHGRVVAGPYRQVAQFSQSALRRRLTRCVPIPSVRLPSSSRDIGCCTLAGSVLASDRWVHSPLFGDLFDVAASKHV
jgi:hypothetical protein